MKDEVNILLVDDQPAKLLSYEVMLQELGENLIKASSAREALEQLLKREIAIVLVDVCMPELDGFQLAAMIREHPRFQKTAIIFISAVHLTDMDRLRGYAMGAVDYVPVPVIPDVLRAKVKVFAELYRKTRQLEQLNQELERLNSSDEDLIGRTVLLVDDDARNIFALSSVLERRGMRVLTATTGNEAIELVDSTPDLAIVLMDIMMPEMDGYQTIEAIRAKPKLRRLPIVALTAKAMKGDREKCLEAGASDYLAKPVNTEQLLSSLRMWLHR